MMVTQIAIFQWKGIANMKSDVRDFQMLSSVQPTLSCLLYTSDAADERSSVDLGGRRILKKKKNETHKYRETS